MSPVSPCLMLLNHVQSISIPMVSPVSIMKSPKKNHHILLGEIPLKPPRLQQSCSKGAVGGALLRREQLQQQHRQPLNRRLVMGRSANVGGKGGKARNKNIKNPGKRWKKARKQHTQTTWVHHGSSCFAKQRDLDLWLWALGMVFNRGEW